MLVASASWMEVEENAVAFSLWRLSSISRTDCRRLSSPSWTLCEWAMEVCRRSERSAIREERLWKRLTMESEGGARESQAAWEKTKRARRVASVTGHGEGSWI